jgi:hypothetical protein
MQRVFVGSIICTPVFLALGLIPSLMARTSARRSRKARAQAGGART